MKAARTNRTSQPIGHRRYARFPVSLPVVGRTQQFPGKALPGMVRDVGLGGLMAEFQVLMVSGSALGLELQTRWGPLQVEGTVVWTAFGEGAIRHGVAFPEPKKEDFAIDLFVAGNPMARGTEESSA